MENFKKYTHEQLIDKIKGLLERQKGDEEKFQNIVTSMDDIVFVIDKDQKIMYYHASDESQLYSKPADFLNKRISEIVPQHVSELFNEAFAKVKDKESSNFEYSLNIQGETKWFNLQLSAIIKEHKYESAIAVIRDITKLKKAEFKLLESAKMWEDTFRSTADAIMILDNDHTIIQANQKMLDIYKVTFDELIGKKCWEVVHKTKSYIPECPFECTKRSVKREIMEFQIDDKWYMITTDPILNDSNKIIGAVHTMLDFTDRKKAENSILELNKNLDQKIKELGLLLHISQTLIKVRELNKILQSLTDFSMQIADIESTAIYLVQGNQLYLGAATPAIPDDFPEEFRFAFLKDHPHIKKSFKTTKPVLIKDVNKEPLTIKEMEIVKYRKFKSILYIPLLIELRAVGVLILGSNDSIHHFTDSEINMFTTLSIQSALAIENALLNKESKNYSEKLEKNILQLKNTEQKLLELNNTLEIRVHERTEELEAVLNDVERMNKLFIGREHRIKELKDEIKLLKTKLKQTK